MLFVLDYPSDPNDLYQDGCTRDSMVMKELDGVETSYPMAQWDIGMQMSETMP